MCKWKQNIVVVKTSRAANVGEDFGEVGVEPMFATSSEEETNWKGYQCLLRQATEEDVSEAVLRDIWERRLDDDGFSVIDDFLGDEGLDVIDVSDSGEGEEDDAFALFDNGGDAPLCGWVRPCRDMEPDDVESFSPYGGIRPPTFQTLATLGFPRRVESLRFAPKGFVSCAEREARREDWRPAHWKGF